MVSTAMPGSLGGRQGHGVGGVSGESDANAVTIATRQQGASEHKSSEEEYRDMTLPQHRQQDHPSATGTSEEGNDDDTTPTIARRRDDEDSTNEETGQETDNMVAPGEERTLSDYNGREVRPRRRDRDPEHSSLSAMSHISTGLSVDSDAHSVSDTDSAMGDMSSPQSTTSIRSSIYEFVEEHGRTFHRYKQGKYWMPNDQLEQERLDLQHAVFMMLLKGRLGLAPIQKPQQVLDVGTGTGIWAIDFAQLYPSAEVLGTDLSPIQPDYVPSNCRFEVDDAEDDWVYTPHKTFDYIHLRLMFHTFKDHRRVIDSALENLSPGGWMEWQDYYCELQCIDDTLKGTALERWCKLYIDGGKKLGRDMLAPRRYKHLMEEAGFVNVTEERLVIPGNAWPRGKDMKKLGVWQMTNFLDGIHAVTMTIFTRGLGMAPEEVELLLVDVRRDIKDTGIHFYFLTYFVYGQKPEEKGRGKRRAS